ncbi:MAG: hypothetical protein QXX08_02355 [Candidatus Bathyarchaeia archaeon]
MDLVISERNMRSSVFLAVAGVLLAALVLVAVLFGLGSGGFGGRGRGYGGLSGVPRYVWIVLIIVFAVALVIFLAYSWVFPDISEKKPPLDSYHKAPAVERSETALDAVLRVSNEEERKVIETLVTEGGTMLQKDIRWKTGLSRVKTHRILLRLAERGIVSAEKYYNTNKIKLADWLTKDNNKHKKDSSV